jgi:surface carbohydrate biosynthesis protein
MFNTSNNKKIAVLFPIETTARELHYKLALGLGFAASGFTTLVGSKERINDLLGSMQSYIYFDKSYHKGVSDKIYRLIKKQKGLIINLDEEGGVDYEDFSVLSVRYPEILFDIADMIFLWGSRQYDFLKSSRTKFNDAKVIVSGHPRFELLKPQFHALYEKETHRLKSTYGNYILFNTNMSFGNNIRGDDFVRSNYGPRIRNIDNVMRFHKQKFEAYKSLILKLSPRVKCNIILRPHPEEEVATYRQTFSNLKNVHVLFEGSVIPWILSSDVLIHPDCTTAIESLMLGRKAISYLPNTDKENIYYLPVALSTLFTDENAVIDYIVEKRYSNSCTDSSHALLESFFSFNHNSMETIVNKVANITIAKNIRTSGMHLGLYTIQRNLISIILGIATPPHKNKAFDKLLINKRKGLGKEVVITFFNELSTILGLSKRAGISHVCDGLYKISPVSKVLDQ